VKLSVRTKATLLATTLVVALLGVVGVVQDRGLAVQYQGLLREQQDALAESVADDLGDKLDLHMMVLEQSGTLLDAGTLADPAARQRFLSRVAPARPMFDGIAIVGLDGTVLANDPPHPPGTVVSVRDRPYFRKLLASGMPTISAPLQSRTGEGAAVLMAAPVRDGEGRMIAVVAGGLQLQRAGLFGELAQAPVGRTGHFEVVTRGPNPVYVVHADPARPLTAAAPPADNGDIVTRKLIRAVDWELRVVLPAWEARAPGREAQRQLIWQLSGLGLAAALFIWLGMRWLLQPLATLRDAIRDQRLEPGAAVQLDLSGDDERGQLAREFAALMQELQDRQAELAAVVEASPLGFFRTDPDGRMIYVNDAYLRMHGLARGEGGDGWLQLIDAEARAEARARWREIVRRPESFATTRRLRLRDGRSALFVVRTAPLLIDGRLTGHVGTVADVTERDEADRAMRLLTTIFDSTPDYVVQTDRHGRVSYMNPAARQAAGIAADAPVHERNFAEFNTPATNRRFTEEVVPHLHRHGVWLGETTVYAQDRRERPVSHMVIAHRGTDGRIEHYSAVLRDISAEAHAKQAERRQTAILRSVTEAIPAIVAVVGADGCYRFVNSTFERWRGLPRDRILGRSLTEVLGRDDHERSRPWIERALAGDTVSFEREYPALVPPCHLAITYIPLRLDDGRIDGFVGIGHDITRHRMEESRLLELSQKDALTGLLNRAGFEEHLARRLREGAGGQVALLYIDLDHFKPVNDTHGHPVGDRLLQAFGQRLRTLVRPTDAVARLGGDEFAVVLTGVRETTHAQRVADKVIAAAAAPFELDGLVLRIGASVGVAIGIGAQGGWQELVARADSMLYRAKQSGRGRHAGTLH
jgi:diguanylate cyclase (GGDEF)-like protein/PAS domain S-box-containing protein